jgi:hypothetical protein
MMPEPMMIGSFETGSSATVKEGTPSANSLYAVGQRSKSCESLVEN